MPVTGLPPRHFLRGAWAKPFGDGCLISHAYRLAPTGGSLKAVKKIFPLMPFYSPRHYSIAQKKNQPGIWIAGLKYEGLFGSLVPRRQDKQAVFADSYCSGFFCLSEVLADEHSIASLPISHIFSNASPQGMKVPSRLSFSMENPPYFICILIIL